MRILLLGELSGLHQELQTGLEALGHDVVTACFGQAQAGFDTDIHFWKAPPALQNKLGWSIEILLQVAKSRRLTGFDIVQLIAPKVFHWKVQKPLIEFIRKFNKALWSSTPAAPRDTIRSCERLATPPAANARNSI